MSAAKPKYPSVIGLVNLKGGVGKTTVCVNLAYGLAYFKKLRVLLVDLDPQANATQYLMSQKTYRKLFLGDAPAKSTVVELYDEYNHANRYTTRPPKDPAVYIQRVYGSDAACLDLVASKLELSLVGFDGGYGQEHEQIRWLIEAVGDAYDYVFIDCPPTVSRMLMAGFEAAESLLVPMKPDFLSTIGLPLLHQVITQTYSKKIERRPNWMAPLNLLGIVYTMFDSRLTMTQESQKDIEAEAKRLNYTVFESRLSNSTRYAWSARNTLPVFRTEPSSRFALEVEQLVDEFIRRHKASARVQP